MVEKGEAESLGAGYFWVGSKTTADELQCNPYLLVDGEEAVLFYPGAALDPEKVAENIASIIPLEKVKYLVLHNQEANLASALPKLVALGMRFTIVTRWRIWSLIRFYGIEAATYLMEEHGDSLKLASGRVLQFIHAPQPRFSDAAVTYDREAKFLLSGDLFSAFSRSWSLFAGEEYAEGMKAFHWRYLSSPGVLKPSMDIFSRLDLAAILPQHGSIINHTIKAYIDILSNLESGTPPKIDKEDLGGLGEYKEAIERLYAQFATAFGQKSAQAAASMLGVSFDRQTGGLLECRLTGLALWNRLSEAAYLLEGNSALTTLEPFVAKLCAEFRIPRPEIYTPLFEEIRRNHEDLSLEVAKLQQINDQLSQACGGANETQMRDAATGLYNETFFRDFIDEQASLTLESEGLEDDVLAVLGVDEGMARIEYQYGPREVEAILKGVSRVILENKAANQLAFRLHGTSFALWMPRILFHEANDLCERMRKSIEISKSFIEPVTISIGLVAVAEIKELITSPTEAGSSLSDIGIRRLRLARKRGGNSICASSEVGKQIEAKARVLIVDDDGINAGVIKTFLENADYVVETAEDGDRAVGKISEQGFDLIISELMIPKIDGFMLKETLSRKSGTKDIPFILLSHLKDEKTVIRAYSLGIDHYLQKPFLLAELLGIVQNMTLASGAGQ